MTAPTEPMTTTPTTPDQHTPAPVITAVVVLGTTAPFWTADGTPRGPVGVVWPVQEQEAGE